MTEVRRTPGARAGGTALRIASVFPELLGTYGDGGNATILANRSAWRGVPTEIVGVRAGGAIPQTCDIYLLGGGEDEPQALAAAGIREGGHLAGAVEAGAVLFAVCAGFQIVGTTFPGTDGKTHPGAGIVDVVTRPGAARSVGDLVVEPTAATGLDMLYGYENHNGRTTLGAGVEPLGTVRRGVGNGAGQRLPSGTAELEGIWMRRGAGRIVGTYLHGPALAQNPQLADLLLREVIGAFPELDGEDPRLTAADAAAGALRAARARQTGRR